MNGKSWQIGQNWSKRGQIFWLVTQAFQRVKVHRNFKQITANKWILLHKGSHTFLCDRWPVTTHLVCADCSYLQRMKNESGSQCSLAAFLTNSSNPLVFISCWVNGTNISNPTQCPVSTKANKLAHSLAHARKSRGLHSFGENYPQTFGSIWLS